ncbi:MAG: hypothetical protein MUC57_02010 [Desulfobacterales bacterium]|jgi:hypothetical protein|nr:hypothetical protein [Desulfobacterales bacterium]
MITRLIRKTTGIVGWILLSACTCLAFDADKGGELNRALEEIETAARLIDANAATAATVHGQLQAQAEALSVEIQQERLRRSVATFQQALQVDRIRYDLLVLQQVRGYLVQLGDRIAYLRTAAHALNVYRDQIRDDRLMLQALNDVDSSGLLRQVREAVDQYRRQCCAAFLQAQAAYDPRELEVLWNGSVKGH